MRTTAVLFSLLLCFAVGCGSEATTAVKAPQKLEVVNSTTLEMLTASKPVILLDFSASW